MPRQCGGALQEFHGQLPKDNVVVQYKLPRPSPSGIVEVHYRSSIAHSPQEV